MSKETGRVIGHVTDTILLRDVKFIVSKKGVDRIRASGRKQVVGYAEGYFVDYKGLDGRPPAGYEGKYYHSEGIYFNPYKYDTFVNACGQPLYYKEFVQINKDGWIYGWHEASSVEAAAAEWERQKELASKPLQLMTGFAINAVD